MTAPDPGVPDPGTLPAAPPAAVAPASAPASLPRHRRWLERSDAIAEWAIVLLMVISAVASAVSYDNATRFADEAEDLATDAMFVAALDGQAASRANTAVVHDQRVALGCIAAAAERDAAITAYSQRFDPAELARAAAAEQRRVVLRGLLLSVQPCAEYDAEAGVVDLGGTRDFDSPDWRAMLIAARQASQAVPLAVAAAVLMAVVLLLLTLADLSRQPRWVWTWLVLAIVVAAAGGVLAVAAVLASGGDAGSLLPILVVMVVVLALFLVLTRRLNAAVQRGVAARAAAHAAAGDGTGTGTDAPRPRRRVLAWMPRQGTWWAEVLGAITLVAFAFAVLALSDASTRQERAVVDAERYALESRQALELGEQAALGVLAYVEELATRRGPAEPGDGPAAGDGAGVAAPVLERWALETAAWERRLAALVADDPGGGWHTCLDPAEILPWRHADEPSGEALPVALADRQRIDPNALGLLVERSTAGATRCSTQTAVGRLEAAQWGAAGSSYTVALLVLGLAGFLFALASDDGRSAWPRRWLLGSAVVGITAGIGLTVATWVASPSPRVVGDVDAGASAFARARVALVAADCATAREEAAVAASALDGLASADRMLADAIGCQPDSAWKVAPHLPPGDVEAYIAAHERARARGGTGHASSLSLGWGYLLRGLGLPGGAARDAALADAERLNLESIEDPRLSPWGCFNVALATLARGDEEAALARYADVLATLDEPARETGWCPDNPDLGHGLRDQLVLIALADLELLDPADSQRARALLVHGDVPAAGGTVPGVEGVTITAGPQRLGLEVPEGSALAGRGVQVAWYQRPDASVPWSVLYNPSLASLPEAPLAKFGWWTYRASPDGELRADVYVDGQLAGSVESTDDWWATNNLDAADWHHVDFPDLGVSVILPRAWREVSSVPGVEIRFGDGADGVAIRRVEGASGDDMLDRLQAWSGQEAAAEAVLAPASYLGLQHSASVAAPDGTWLGAGYQQYLAPPLDASAVTSVEDGSCPATLLMTSVRAADPGVQATVWQSQELVEPPPTVPADAVAVSSPFVSSSFSIAIADGWSAVACPQHFMAGAPGAGTAVLVSIEPTAVDLDTFAGFAAEFYGTQFADYVLEELVPVELANGLPARRLTSPGPRTRPASGWSRRSRSRTGPRSC